MTEQKFYDYKYDGTEDRERVASNKTISGV